MTTPTQALGSDIEAGGLLCVHGTWLTVESIRPGRPPCQFSERTVTTVEWATPFDIDNGTLYLIKTQ